MSIFRRGAWKQVILGGGKSEWLLLMNDFRHHSFACCLFIHCYQLHIDYTCIWHMNDFNRLWLAGNWLTNTTDSQYQWLPDWLIDWLIDRRMDRQTVRLTDNTEWLNDFRTDWLTGSAGWYTNVLNIVSINVAVLKLFSIRHISWVNK